MSVTVLQECNAESTVRCLKFLKKDVKHNRQKRHCLNVKSLHTPFFLRLTWWKLAVSGFIHITLSHVFCDHNENSANHDECIGFGRAPTHVQFNKVTERPDVSPLCKLSHKVASTLRSLLQLRWRLSVNGKINLSHVSVHLSSCWLNLISFFSESVPRSAHS